jgi:hypothetical protein
MLSVRHFVLITLVSATSAAALTGCDDTKPVTATDGGATGGTTGAGGTVATGGTTGAGGAAATGGTTGAGGTTPGSDAGTPPASGCMIPCIVALTQDCIPSGACTEATAGTTNNRCYANGVKVSTAAVLLPPSLTLTSKKPDGSACYTVVGTLTSLQSTTAMLVLKNAAGQQVGTGTYNVTTMEGAVMCDGASFDAVAVASCGSVLRLPSLPGSSPSGDCTAGACTP